MPPPQGCCEVVGNPKKSLGSFPDILTTQKKSALIILNDDDVMMMEGWGGDLGGTDFPLKMSND